MCEKRITEVDREASHAPLDPVLAIPPPRSFQFTPSRPSSFRVDILSFPSFVARLAYSPSTRLA